MPVITLPDGNQKHFDHPVSIYQVAESIGTGLAKAALAGKIKQVRGREGGGEGGREGQRERESDGWVAR